MTETIPISPKTSGDDALSQLFERYAEKKESHIRDILVLSHLNLVRFLASKFTGKGEPLEDLVQVGTIGLINAVERFEPSRGNKFSSYAAPTIVGELKRHFRDKTWKIKVPRHLQELNLRIPKATEDFVLRFERQPTLLELADLLNATEEDTFEALNLGIAYETVSLDELIPDTEGKPLRLEEFQGEIDQEIVSINRFGDLYKAIESLDEIDPRYKKIINLRFFSDLTQTEIAKEVGICQMHVSRLLAKALRHLNTFLANENKMINTEGEDEMGSRRGRHRNRANSNGNGNRPSTVTPASNTTSTLEIAESKPKETVTTPTVEKKVDVVTATEKPTVFNNGLAFLMVEWPRLSYTEPKEINFPNIIKNSPVNFVEKQLEPILQSLIHLGIIKEVRNGFLRGQNEVKIGVKHGLEGFYLRNRMFKKDEPIDLDKECADCIPSQSEPKHEKQGQPPIITKVVNVPQETKMPTLPLSPQTRDLHTVSANHLKVLRNIWPILSDSPIVLDSQSINDKTGISKACICNLLTELCEREILAREGKGGRHAPFKYKKHPKLSEFKVTVQLATFEKKRGFELRPGLVINHEQSVVLDDLFSQNGSTNNTSKNDDNPGTKPVNEQAETEFHSNGNGNLHSPSISDPPSEDLGIKKESPENMTESGEKLDSTLDNNSTDNQINFVEEQPVDVTTRVNHNDILAKIELCLCSLYAEAGRIKLTIKETERALVSLRSTSQLLKKDYTCAINDLEEELDDLYIETRNNKLSIASAEESKMALMAKR